MIEIEQSNHVIKITSTFPIGVGSFGNTVSEIMKTFPKVFDICKEVDLNIKNAILLTKAIDHIIDQYFEDSTTFHDTDWINVKSLWITYIGDPPNLKELIRDIELEINKYDNNLKYDIQIVMMFMCGNQKDWEYHIKKLRPDANIKWYSEFIALISSNTSLLGFRDEIQEIIYTPLNEVFPAISFCREECLDK